MSSHAACEQIGPIHTLINGAARGSTAATAEEESVEQIAGTLTVNLAAPLVLAQLVYPNMRAAGRGWIVNVGSIAGEVGIGRIPQASYAASKGGLHALTRSWRRSGAATASGSTRSRPASSRAR